MAKHIGGELLGHKKDKSGTTNNLSDKQALKEALKFAKHKGKHSQKHSKHTVKDCTFLDVSKLDPRVMDYAATKLQAGFRGWQTRQRMKNGNM